MTKPNELGEEGRIPNVRLTHEVETCTPPAIQEVGI